MPLELVESWDSRPKYRAIGSVFVWVTITLLDITRQRILLIELLPSNCAAPRDATNSSATARRTRRACLLFSQGGVEEGGRVGVWFLPLPLVPREGRKKKLADSQFPCEWKTTIFRKFSRQKKLEDKDAFSTPSKTKFTLLS